MSEQESDGPREGVCEFCQYETTVSRREVYRPMGYALPASDVSIREAAWLCDICADSGLGIAFSYPRDHDVALFSAIGWIANHVMDELRRHEKRTTE